MGPGHFMGNGFWIIPIVMMILCFFMFRAGFGRRGGCFPFGNDERDKQSGGEVESPLEILKRRYARGEITKAEFEDMKQNL